MKTCTTCKQTKGIDEFGNDRSRKDGKDNKCRECVRARAKTLYATRKGYFVEYRQERQEHYNELARQKYAENPEAFKKPRQERTITCAHCGRQIITTDSRKKYCDRKCSNGAWGFRKRATRAGATFTKEERGQVFVRDNGVCQLCLKPVDTEAVWPMPLFAVVDHIVPLSKGGTHELKNWQLAHNRCNGSKSNKI